MKTQFTLTLLAAFSIAIFSVTAANFKYKKDSTIEITKKSTQFYLDSLTAALKNNGIVLKLDQMEFNEQGQLKIISGRVYFSKTCYGAFSTENLDKIIIRKVFGEISIAVNPKDK